MCEIIFLFVIGLIWVLFASVEDLRKREVANWISFSLIIFALGFRFFYGLFDGGFGLFFQGLVGVVLFYFLGNLLYYGKMFAGGDTKIMYAMGAILPWSVNFYDNLKIFFIFIVAFLFAGAIYGFFSMIFFSLKNWNLFRKDFMRRLGKNIKIVYPVMFFGLVLMALGFVEGVFFAVGILVFISSYFYIYAKSVDSVCMVREVKVSQLTEGDWLPENVRIGRKMVKASWDGLSKKDIVLIKKKYKKIKVKYGIPFVPVFLIALLMVYYLWKTGLWHAFW